jgi:hypothetical protein
MFCTGHIIFNTGDVKIRLNYHFKLSNMCVDPRPEGQKTLD